MAHPTVNTRKYDILLVENDEVDVLSIQRAFKKHDIQHHLTVVNNGMEALQTLRERMEGPKPWRPHFILLDINMPLMNGLEFLMHLRSEPFLAPVPVFMLTTSDEPRDRESAYKYHVSGYIVKPMNSQAFERALLDLNRYWEMNEFPEATRQMI
jgi:CheY-like chemotaxis protein